MTATNHTEHYGLSQYTEGDRPTYTGDYNGDMSKIDAAIYAASQSGGGGMAAVEHTADLTGDGSTGNPLGVADTIARTKDIPSLDNYATTTGLTAKESDMQYSDGYNIVRVGTPTRSTETEDSSHE